MSPRSQAANVSNVPLIADRFCECGCGELSPIAATTSRKWNHVAGQRTRFIKGHHLRQPTPEISHADLCWLAGLLEGEGSFLVSTRYRHRKTTGETVQVRLPCVTVTMTDRDVIDRAAALMGVSTYDCKQSALEVELNRKPKFSARVYVPRAIPLMIRLRPHMGTRRQGQIDVALEPTPPTSLPVKAWPSLHGGCALRIHGHAATHTHVGSRHKGKGTSHVECRCGWNADAKTHCLARDAYRKHLETIGKAMVAALSRRR